MRPIWKGCLSFGLVTIPVKVYAATEDQSVHFNQLHKGCGGRISYRKYCLACDAEVPPEQIAKGYQLPGGEYVVVSEDELAQFEAEQTRGIEITAFVRTADVDPIYFDRSYYLEPADIGHKAYGLLRTALERTGKAALARIVMRSREALALVRISGAGLVLNTMHWPAEIRDQRELSGLGVQPAVRDQEVDVAVRLVESLSTEFDPAAYRNTHDEALRAFIEHKGAAGEGKRPPAQTQGADVVDLMEALQRSLAAMQKPKTKRRKKEVVGA